MTVIIRKAIPADFAAMARLLVEAYQEYAASLTPVAWEQMRVGLASVDRLASVVTFLVAEDNHHLAGAVAYYQPGMSDPRLFPRHWASLRLLAVAPAHRGRGLGRRLTEACVARAREDGAGEIGLHTSELMVTARQMYERMGFCEVGELPPMFGLRYWRFVLPLMPAA
ncbi:MAG: GNAT family N-acetyltransferase [Desulfobulbaceae bacterium]